MKLELPGASATLRGLENSFPGFHAWIGISADRFYARRLRSSPPVVFEARTVAGLRAQITAYIAAGEPSWKARQ